MTDLSSEASRPASMDDIMSAIDAASTQPRRSTPARRGRPPGSKNKTPLQKLAESDPAQAKKAEEAAAREVKKKRAAEIESSIYTELNDQLMTVVMGMFNVPADWLYLPGKGPVVRPKDERFTDIGNALAIPQSLAHSIGRLAAELEQTSIGQSVSGVGQNQNVGLIVAGGMTAFGVFQYAKQLNNTFERLKPIIDAQKAMKEARAKGEEPTPTNTGDNLAHA